MEVAVRRGRSRGGGVGRGESEGAVRRVDEDWFRKGCCGPEAFWDKNFIVLLFCKDVLFHVISFPFVTRNKPILVTRNSAI